MRENHIHILVGNYYKVINGPVDSDWLQAYYEKHKAMYGE